jgi:hypothetical protein
VLTSVTKLTYLRNLDAHTLDLSMRSAERRRFPAAVFLAIMVGQLLGRRAHAGSLRLSAERITTGSKLMAGGVPSVAMSFAPDFRYQITVFSRRANRQYRQRIGDEAVIGGA